MLKNIYINPEIYCTNVTFSAEIFRLIKNIKLNFLIIIMQFI